MYFDGVQQVYFDRLYFQCWHHVMPLCHGLLTVISICKCTKIIFVKIDLIWLKLFCCGCYDFIYDSNQSRCVRSSWIDKFIFFRITDVSCLIFLHIIKYVDWYFNWQIQWGQHYYLFPIWYQIKFVIPRDCQKKLQWNGNLPNMGNFFANDAD